MWDGFRVWIQVGPASSESAWIEIGLYPKFPQNHILIPAVLFCTFNPKICLNGRIFTRFCLFGLSGTDLYSGSVQNCTRNTMVPWTVKNGNFFCAKKHTPHSWSWSPWGWRSARPDRPRCVLCAASRSPCSCPAGRRPWHTSGALCTRRRAYARSAPSDAISGSAGESENTTILAKAHPHRRRIGIPVLNWANELPLTCVAVCPHSSGRITIRLPCV